MARLRQRGNLSCFYCGKKSIVKFDGRIRDFLCLHCDATNYLDANGDITDPPIAETRHAQQTRYAVPRNSLAPELTGPSQSIFCQTCLKNQHLFTSSLAQYLPDDPNHPEYQQLEKGYFKFRRRLEERYPQICADCEPKVLAKVNEAGYTARTDHLRRMMDRSREKRTAPKHFTALDGFDKLGRWLWLTGLVCQLLWHVVSAADLVVAKNDEEDPLRDPDEVLSTALTILGAIPQWLPNAPWLIWLSMWSNVVGLWWNPRFVQVFRGFSKHIIGLSQWYIFQGLVIMVRYIGMRMTELHEGQDGQTTARLSLHALLAFVMTVFYALARKAVRVDTTPLFQATSPTATPPRRAPVAKDNTPKNMSNLLDEILAQPTNPAPPSPQAYDSPTSSFSPPQPIGRPAQPSAFNLGSLDVVEQQQQQPPPVQYPEEMEWSPTQSKHRAFNDFGPPGRQSQGFGDSPTNPGAGSFWYKVPPAPTAPAAKLRKPSAPVFRSKPAGRESIFFPSNEPPAPSEARRRDEEQHNKVSFAPPSFFAGNNANNSDPRGSLADMLTSSFNLSLDEELDDDEVEMIDRPARPDIELKVKLPSRGRKARDRIMDMFLLVVLLGTWWHATSAVYSYSRDVMLGSIGLTLAVGVRLTGDAVAGLNAKRGSYPASVASVALGACELVTACFLAGQVWSLRESGLDMTLVYRGIGLMGSMLVHCVWCGVV